MNFKVAIIGFGYWGPKLSRNFSNSNYFNLHSISDLKSLNLSNIVFMKNPNLNFYWNEAVEPDLLARFGV